MPTTNTHPVLTFLVARPKVSPEIGIHGEWVTFAFAESDLDAWRSGWPCSSLEGCTYLRAEFQNGDLVDIEHPGIEDLDAHELLALVLDSAVADGAPALRGFIAGQRERFRNS